MELLQHKEHSTLKKDYRILRTNFIKEIKSVEKSTHPFDGNEKLPPINIARLRNKEASTLRELEIESERIGIGVTKEAQQIFNALSKTYPCHWQNQNIVVFNEVVISSPYTIDNCNGGDSMMLERIKKVVKRNILFFFKIINCTIIMNFFFK